MKRLISIVVVAAIATIAWAITHVAEGIGVVEGGSFAGAHFEFLVQVPEDRNERNYFTFYDHGMFIPVDITMTHMTRVQFGRNSVTFWGRGTYNGSTPVNLTVSATDGGPQQPDHFSMFARDLSGVLIHSAQGQVIEGQLVVLHH